MKNQHDRDDLINYVAQRTHDVIMTSVSRQNDLKTSFWRNTDVIITSCVRWEQTNYRGWIYISDGPKSPHHIENDIHNTVPGNVKTTKQTKNA